MNQQVGFDVQGFRKNFPILEEKNSRGKQLIYFDNGASTQKPQCVINAITDFLSHKNANVHRGIHFLSERADSIYETTRSELAAYFNIRDKSNVIFTAGTTNGLNIIAKCYAQEILKSGDEIIISDQEHHANIIPWQQAIKLTGAKLRVCRSTPIGDFDLDNFKSMLSSRTKIVSVAYITNVFGARYPIDIISELTHKIGATFVLDGAHCLGHKAIDVTALDCDFFLCSCNKGYGPTGIGFMYAKGHLLQQMKPYEFGGNMILNATFDDASFKDIPDKFETGTPNTIGVAGALGAIEFLKSIDFGLASTHAANLVTFAIEELTKIDGVDLVLNPSHRAGVISMVMKGVHPHDMSTILDTEGIATRAGHHCAQPLMKLLNLSSTLRLSFGLYNTTEEIAFCCDVLKSIRSIL
ncbi:MAG: cysteine desulfurase [Puniceicoccales bacterium]|jgi:cysteine desulfurase/selenocysteine lyase|nr:cysteine desulfurase [Puniceicoccales bacterium]